MRVGRGRELVADWWRGAIRWDGSCRHVWRVTVDPAGINQWNELLTPPRCSTVHHMNTTATALRTEYLRLATLRRYATTQRECDDTVTAMHDVVVQLCALEDTGDADATRVLNNLLDDENREVWAS